MKGFNGKEFERVFDSAGRAIGKKDSDGNFIAYKDRGRKKKNADEEPESE